MKNYFLKDIFMEIQDMFIKSTTHVYSCIHMCVNM